MRDRLITLPSVPSLMVLSFSRASLSSNLSASSCFLLFSSNFSSAFFLSYSRASNLSLMQLSCFLASLSDIFALSKFLASRAFSSSALGSFAFPPQTIQSSGIRPSVRSSPFSEGLSFYWQFLYIFQIVIMILLS